MRAQRRLKDDLEQEIAELFAVLLGVAGVDGLEHLVRFFDQVGLQRLQRLLAIPRAAVGCQQSLHDLDQFGKCRSALRDRHLRSKYLVE